jgi:hypothetical protein
VQFTSFNHLIERGVFWELRLKESRDTYKTHRSNTHAFSNYSYGSDDENQECMAAEIRWPTENKMVTCMSLKPIHKNRGEEIKFTFGFSKCDRIFDELLKFSYIRINYTLPSIDELKKRVYCKYHNSFSHATNDCNVFHRQVQSALNEGRLSLSDMKVDKISFPMHTIEARPPTLLIRPEQADKVQCKNVIIGEPRAAPNVQVNSRRKVMLEKDEEGKNKLKITAGSTQFINSGGMKR